MTKDMEKRKKKTERTERKERKIKKQRKRKKPLPDELSEEIRPTKYEKEGQALKVFKFESKSVEMYVIVTG